MAPLGVTYKLVGMENFTNRVSDGWLGSRMRMTASGEELTGSD
jgi:hypothetical protein